MSGRCFDPCVNLWSLMFGLWVETVLGDCLWSLVFDPRLRLSLWVHCATTFAAEHVSAEKMVSIGVLIQLGSWCFCARWCLVWGVEKCWSCVVGPCVARTASTATCRIVVSIHLLVVGLWSLVFGLGLWSVMVFGLLSLARSARQQLC